MNFIRFNLLLLIAEFVAVLLFSIGVMACMLPVAPFWKRETPPKAILILSIALAGVYQVYFWGLWAAFCVAATMRFTQKLAVTWDWIYWICGFMGSISVIGWLNYKEQQGNRDVVGESGAMFYSLIVIVAFLVFAFAPNLAEWPYGWFMNLIGYAKYMNG